MTWFYHIHLIRSAVSSFPAVQEVVNRSREFRLNNLAVYYFNVNVWTKNPFDFAGHLVAVFFVIRTYHTFPQAM